jgi:hypothetical protein
MSWTLMIIGFGALGGTMRWRRRKSADLGVDGK